MMIPHGRGKTSKIIVENTIISYPNDDLKESPCNTVGLFTHGDISPYIELTRHGWYQRDMPQDTGGEKGLKPFKRQQGQEERSKNRRSVKTVCLCVKKKNSGGGRMKCIFCSLV